MKVPFVDLKKQYEAIKEEIDASIQAVLASGEFVSGSFVSSFEKHFAKAHSAKYCVAVSSGTAALHIALWALGIGNGAEVIVPTHTFIASAASINLTGAKPIFVDCEERYFNLDPEKIEQAITPQTRAILAVHLYGQPAQMDKIKKIATKHNLFLIEDCAQAHLATFQGQPVGTFGNCGCFSFYPSKNLGAYGEGGAVLTHDKALYEKMLMLREHGSDKKYHHPILGHNYRMQGFQGAILDVKLKHLKQWTQKRRKNAKLYAKHLETIPEIKLPEEIENGQHVFHLYVIRSPERDSLIEFLKQHEIATAIHYPIPCHMQECYRSLGYREHYPVTENLVNEIISLPLYPELTEEQIQFTSKKIKDFFYATQK